MPRQVIDSTPGASRTRRQGAHAGLDLDQIVDAASRLDPESLTMRAVAAELGVDHKALNHHVRDRETLMGLIAWRAFSTRYVPDMASHTEWRGACRAFANSFVDAAIPVGSLTDYLNLRNSPTAVVIEQVDILLGTLVNAGFTDESALRLVTLLSTICTAHAQDVSAAASNARPRREIVQRVLDDTTGPVLPNLARILPEQIDTYGHRQLEVSLDVFIAGAGTLLGISR